MDYLDFHKQRRIRLTLLVGYVFVAAAIVIGATVLVYQAYGFGRGKNGVVIQNSLVFISSQPRPANIYLNGVRNSSATNARLLLPAGIYQLKLARSGYRDWRRAIGVDGGTVVHFDYPLLLPVKLTASKIQAYTAAPGLAAQSPDRRWLLVEQPGSDTNFDLYDLKDPKRVASTLLTLPSNVVSKPTTGDSWQLGEWADDNQHVLLQHNYDGKSEFILVDRQKPDQSLNLNSTFAVEPTKITLNNKKYNQFYLYDAAAGVLQTATLSSPAPTPLLTHVLAYQTYGNRTVLYVTGDQAPPGKVLVKLAVGPQTYIIHTFSGGGPYLLDLTQYAGTLYVAAGASQENKVYIYKDPISQLNAQPSQAVSPIQVLHVDAPDYLSFSTNAQFVLAEHGTQFGVYDILNKNGYNYKSNLDLDAPQLHAAWMDGDRLTYISESRLVIFDYDDANSQTLTPLASAYPPFFAADYHYVYGLAPGATAGQTDLTQTPLLTPADL